MEILTNNFKSDVNRLFITDTEANHNYYMVVSTIGNFDPVDSAASQNEFLENILFGKRINNDDINFMIRYYPWQRGQAYAQYDDTIDLGGLKYYAVVGPNDNDTGDYRIYKCLDNNRSGVVESPPTYDAANLNQIYETADGYVWKYMYRLSTLQFEAYNALGYIPIDPNYTTPSSVVGGGMSDIQVENALDNNGYFEKTGFTRNIDYNTSTMTITPKETDWLQIDDAYVGQYLYVTNNVDNVSNLFKIKSYFYNPTSTNADFVLGPEVSNPTKGNVEGATQANPVVITSTAHGLSSSVNQPVTFKGVVGMTEINDLNNDGTPLYYAKRLDADTFALYTDEAATSSVNGTGYGAYTSGGAFTGNKDLEVAGVSASSNIKIFPRIDIVGDGTGAVAIPDIANGKVNRVTILNRGTGYRNATATLIDPNVGFDPDDSATSDVRAVLRPIIEPPGGHGYNIFDEFGCKHFSMYGYITAEDNTNIGDVNTYGAVGIIRTPDFKNMEGISTWRSGQANTNPVPDVFDNRIAIVTNDYGKLTANSTITQIDGSNEIVFTAQVHEIDTSANTVYLAEYMGPNVNNPLAGNADTSFNPNLTIRSEGGQTITINNPVADNIIYSDYIQRSGEVYFMENFFPLARTDLSREEFKFVLEF